MDRYAFSTGALYTYDTIDGLTHLKKAGFNNIELMPQCFSDTSLNTLLKMEKIGIHVSSIHFPLAFFLFVIQCQPKYEKRVL